MGYNSTHTNVCGEDKLGRKKKHNKYENTHDLATAAMLSDQMCAWALDSFQGFQSGPDPEKVEEKHQVAEM